MAESIVIGATRYVDALYERLSKEFDPLRKEGLRFSLKKNPAGKFTFLNCNFWHPRSGGNNQLLLDNVARAICETILDHWERVLLEEIIRETYYYFDPEDRNVILNNALDRISGRELPEDKLPRYRHRQKILNELENFLHSSNHIVIDGFIRFRLKDYLHDLYEAVEDAVDDFLLDKEYKEFVQLLKYFVDIQDSRTERVDVVLGRDGKYNIYDEKGNSLENEMEVILPDIVSSEVNCEDLLISSLVTIAPAKIVFHFQTDNKYKATVETITNVFSGRVEQCDGCSLCREKKE